MLQIGDGFLHRLVRHVDARFERVQIGIVEDGPPGAARGAWWTVFDDADLNALEARVDVSNQTVKKAVADLQQARAMVDYQHAGFLPTITAGAAQSRARVSQNRLGSSLAGKTTPDYQVGVAASWEPDLFGRVRDAVTGAQANAAASAADLQAVKLSVTAE
ncbi:TolC family protein, partial [Burkholderia cenocepacia]|uniref:TolC family protein n=1 Tax=Burkholderia cenocepacia TaxID=95486 RepID=UPI00351C4C5C